MKKIKFGILLAAFAFASSAPAADFSGFLKACGYGALIGAGVGLVSLATENKPSGHYDNIARGASLGLYGGVAYGAYQMAPHPVNNRPMHNDYDLGTYIVPKFQQARVDGLEVNTTVYNF